jgi:hypothetical protein
MLKQKTRWSDWFTGLCVIVLFMVAISRLSLTNWADHLGVVGWLAVLGGGIGYLLGRSKLHWVFTLLISIFSSLVLAPLSFSLLMSEKAGLIPKIIDTWNRMINTGGQLFGNQPVSDSIIFLAAMSVLFWFFGISTWYTLVRSARPWIPLVLMGVTILTIEHYQPQSPKTFYSWFYFVILLILVGRILFLRFKNGLKASNRQISGDTEFDFLRGVVIVAFAIGLFSFFIPGFVRLFIADTREQTRFTQKWESFTSQFENAFYALDKNGNTIEEAIADNMRLGTGQILGNEPVMYIQTNLKNPTSYPFYWRGKVYDIYEDGQWLLGSAYKQSFDPSQLLRNRDLNDGQVLVKIIIESGLPELTQLYTTGEVVDFNRSVNAAVAMETTNQKEFLSYYISPPIQQGEIYRFESVIALPTVDQLMNAGTAYPEWVTDRYLQLPGNLSFRMVELAKQLTQDQVTSYEKAVAITSYLRQNIEYQSTIPTPPRKQDAIDWFLFDYRKGFCNYSASAEVLLLRLAGVPARLVVGYAQGTTSSSNAGFLVKKDDSHAWPEAYFPGYGWILFEPTGSRPEINRTLSADTNNNTPVLSDGGEIQTRSDMLGIMNGEERAERIQNQIGNEKQNQPFSLPKLTFFGWSLVSLALLAFLYGVIFFAFKIIKNREAITTGFRAFWKSILSSIYRIPLLGLWLISLRRSPVERNFLNVEMSLSILRVTSLQNCTAQELAQRLLKLLPALKTDIELLLFQYHQTVFFNRSFDPKSGRLAGRRVLLASTQESIRSTQRKIKKIFARNN